MKLKKSLNKIEKELHTGATSCRSSASSIETIETKNDTQTMHLEYIIKMAETNPESSSEYESDESSEDETEYQSVNDMSIE